MQLNTLIFEFQNYITMKWNRLVNALVWRALNTRTWPMQFKSSLGLMLLCLPLFSFGRGVDTTTLYTARSECINYNTFLEGDSLEALMYFSEKIYPTGLIKFHPTRTHELGGFDDLKPYLDICSNCTFQLASTETGHFDQGRTYTRYQQYYLGVEVEDGGVIMVEDDDNPCGITYLSAFIVSDINVSITPQINLVTLASIVQGIITGPVVVNPAKLRHQLVISHNLNNQCGYSLAWKVEYDDDGRHKAWIDAISGNVLKTIKVDKHLNAPTEVYGTAPTHVVALNDFTDPNGVTTLMTPDQSVIGYDFGGAFEFPSTSLDDHFLDSPYFVSSRIPQTTALIWPSTPSLRIRGVYQAFYSVGLVRDALDNELGFDFKKIHVGAHLNGQETNTAKILTSVSSLDEAFVAFGQYGNGNANSLCVHDVVAHELGHEIIDDTPNFDLGDGDGPRSLEEAICDMIGTYIESVIQGGIIDWQIADDGAIAAGDIARDLSNPNYSLYEEVEDFTQEHDRSEPLGHWFYLISEGTQGISGLGIKPALELVLMSLELMPSSSDYQEMRDHTIALAEELYGPCSEEARVVKRAWHQIGLGNFYCEGDIIGPIEVCEESTAPIIFSIFDPVPNVSYRWNFPIEWTVAGATAGSNEYYGTNLIVTNIPDYSYYSQFFDIYLYSPQVGVESSRTFRMELMDCLNDDDDCDDYYAEIALAKEENNKEAKANSNQSFSLETTVDVALVKVYDLTGRLLFKGTPSSFEARKMAYQNRVLIYVCYDNNGHLLSTQKRIILQ